MIVCEFAFEKHFSTDLFLLPLLLLLLQLLVFCSGGGGGEVYSPKLSVEKE